MSLFWLISAIFAIIFFVFCIIFLIKNPHLYRWFLYLKREKWKWQSVKYKVMVHLKLNRESGKCKMNPVFCFLFFEVESWNVFPVPVPVQNAIWIRFPVSVSKCNSKCNSNSVSKYAQKWAYIAFKRVPATYLPETWNLPPFAFKIGFRFQFQFQFQITSR